MHAGESVVLHVFTLSLPVLWGNTVLYRTPSRAKAAAIRTWPSLIGDLAALTAR